MKKRIMFVCHGNICRSPSAEFIFKDMIKREGLEEEFFVSSAATSDCEIHDGVGDEVYPPAKRELARHGLSCEGKRSVQLKLADYGGYDIFVGMDDANIADMKRILGGDPDGKVFRLLDFTERGGEVDDPWFSHHFDIAYNDIYEGCAALLSKYYPSRIFVRNTVPSDYDRLCSLYAGARERMRAGGNPTQWGDNWPPVALVKEDIVTGIGRAAIKDGAIVGTFVFINGKDPTYDVIDGGAWLNDEPYCVIHRIAGDGKTHGVLAAAVGYASRFSRNVRIDTHADNAVMHHLLAKNGFSRCGIIYVRDGSPRVAYHKVF